MTNHLYILYNIILSYINNYIVYYITIDNILRYGGVILVLLVIWVFWGDTEVRNIIINKLRKKNE